MFQEQNPNIEICESPPPNPDGDSSEFTPVKGPQSSPEKTPFPQTKEDLKKMKEQVFGQLLADWVDTQYQNTLPINQKLFLEYLKAQRPPIASVQITESDLPPTNKKLTQVLRAFLFDKELKNYTAERARDKNSIILGRNGVNFTVFPLAKIQIKIDGQGKLYIDDEKVTGEGGDEITSAVPGGSAFSGIEFYLNEREWLSAYALKVIDTGRVGVDRKTRKLGDIVDDEKAALRKEKYTIDEKNNGDTVWISGDTVSYTIHAKKDLPKNAQFTWHKKNITLIAKPNTVLQREVNESDAS